MSLRLTEEEYAALLTRQASNSATLPRKPSKYRNQKCGYDGRNFDSKHERDHYVKLERMKAGKMIRGFAHQVSVPLASGKRRMRIDFMVVENDGRIRWQDAKGFVTRDWEVKRDELEHHLGIQIETV